MSDVFRIGLTISLLAVCASCPAQAVSPQELLQRLGPNAIGDPQTAAIVQQGIAHLEQKQLAKAVTAFSSAAEQDPNNVVVRYFLGVALLRNKQAGQAWLQFRKAVRLDAGFGPATDEFLLMWNVFDQRRVLEIGRTKQEIAKLLGQPDQKQGNSQEFWDYGFMRLHMNQDRLFGIIDPRGLVPEDTRPTDVLAIDFDDKTRWRLGYRATNRLQSVTEYVLKDESVKEWSELYTVQRLYRLATKKTPSQLMQEMTKNLKKLYPQAEFRTLAVSDRDVLFHWRDVGDKQQSAQHEIVRLVAGAKDIHRLAYSRRVAQIPPQEAQQWIARMQNAKLSTLQR